MFFITQEPILTPPVKEVLELQCPTQPIIEKFNSLNFFLFPKLLVSPTEVFQKSDDSWIFGTGIWSYRHKVEGSGLRLLLHDISNEAFQEDELRGQFAIIYYIPNLEQVKILTDFSGIQNIYIDSNGNISSSFLALLYDSKQPYRVNRKAVLEVLTTGNLISPDTLVEGIKRFHPRMKDNQFGKIQISTTQIKESTPSPAFRNRQNAIEVQIEKMNDLFVRFARLNEKFLTDIGITGGLDSRLLLGFALSNWGKKNLSLYTNTRLRAGEEKIIDEPIAEKVAQATGLPLKMGWMKDPVDLSEEELKQAIKSSYYFSDAHTRMHIQYVEQYNTPGFKLQVLGGSRFNLSGIGGEQYRNQERFLFGRWDLPQFIRYKTMLLVSGESIQVSRLLKEQIDYLSQKVQDRIHCKEKMNHIDVKRYYNEIINGERLGARNNMENKLCWFLSPYAEWTVASAAYQITPFLGTSPSFQSEIMIRVNPKIANIESDYGFTPLKGIPFSIKASNYFKAWLPWNVFYYLRIKPMLKNKRNIQFETLNSLTFIQKTIENVKDLFPELNINELLIRPDFMPIVINVGYFLLTERENGRITG